MGIGADPRDLDPHTVTGIPDFMVLGALFEGLVSHGPWNDQSIIPGVAQSWVSTPDGLTYTFQLRDNAKWSNGDPLTAEDFVFSFERVLNPQFASPHAEMLYAIQGAEAFHQGIHRDFNKVGVFAKFPSTLEIKLSRPIPYFLQLLKHPAWYPVHPDTITRFDASFRQSTGWTQPGNLVSNGPFVLESWKPGNRIEVLQSNHYWGKDDMDLQRIAFYPIDNANTEERAFQNGQLHLTDDVPFFRRADLRSEEDNRYLEYPILATTYLLFNTQKPPFTDPLVRRALALAIDREAITEHIVHTGQPATSFTPGNMPGYEFPLQSGVSFDIEEAQRLLALAGFPAGEGFPEVEYSTSTSDSARQVAEAIQQMWKEHLGISVQLFNSEFRVYLDNLNRGNFDIGYLAWYGDYEDPYTFLNLLRSTSASNRMKWTSDEYDRLIDLSNEATDPHRRASILRDAESFMLVKSPIAPIYWVTTSRYIHPSVKGWEPRLLDLHPYQHIRLEPE